MSICCHAIRCQPHSHAHNLLSAIDTAMTQNENQPKDGQPKCIQRMSQSVHYKYASTCCCTYTFRFDASSRNLAHNYTTQTVVDICTSSTMHIKCVDLLTHATTIQWAMQPAVKYMLVVVWVAIKWISMYGSQRCGWRRISLADSWLMQCRWMWAVYRWLDYIHIF